MFSWWKTALCLLLFSGAAKAAPLGTIPTVEEGHTRFTFIGRSDLWTSPYRDKAAPVRIFESRLRIPIYKNNGWVASVGSEFESLSSGRSDLLIGEEKDFIGTDFRNQSLGLALSYHAEDGSSFSFFSAYTSSSDEPFKHSRDVWMETAAVFKSSPQAYCECIFGLTYSKNRGYFNNEVFPFFGVIYKAENGFKATFGFPFAKFEWTLRNDWQSVVMLTPVGKTFDISKTLSEKYETHFRGGITTRGYLNESRIDDNTRAYFEEKFIDLVFKTDLSEQTSVGFGVGYAWDRSMYQGLNVFRPQGERTRLSSDIMGGMYLEFRL